MHSRGAPLCFERRSWDWEDADMATIDNALKVKLEHLFDMAGGYVLDYTDRSFAEFVRGSIAVDPYELHRGSKAQVLRHLWAVLPNRDFAKLTSDMLAHRQLIQDLGHYTPGNFARTDGEVDRRLIEQVQAQLQSMSKEPHRLTREEAAFLAKDFGTVDLANAQVPVDLQSVVADRLEEIETCLEHDAPLAVVFLCGSTLEGLLYEVAKRRPADFNRAAAAPKREQRVLPLHQWPLSGFLDVARELGILGEDVAKFAHSVREFRNYVHPHQQVKEGFRPRPVTAQMARNVLRAAIEDLSHHPQE